MGIIKGQEIEDPHKNSTPTATTPDDGDLFGDEEFLEDSATKQLKGQVSTLNAQVENMGQQLNNYQSQEQEQTNQRALSEVQNSLDTALSDHPFTKESDNKTRTAIAELAMLDVRRYQHEGVTHEMAVTRWANHFEGLRRKELGAQLDAAQNQPAVPPPPGSGSVIPQPAAPGAGSLPGGFFDSGQFGSGLRQALTTKEDYTIHGLTDQINREAEFFGRVRRSSKEVRGKYGVIPVFLQGNRNATGARSELDKLPDPAYQKTAIDSGGGRIAGQVGMKFNTGRFAITEPAIQAAATSVGAFESSLEVEMKGLTMDMANDLNRQHMSGDGTGTLCVVSGTPAASYIDVIKPGGQQCYPSADDVDGAKFVEVDDVVAIYSSAGVFRGTCGVTAVDYSATPNRLTLNLDPTGISVVATDVVYKASTSGLTGANTDQDAKDNEIEGLLKWINDTGAAGNIDPSLSGNERWASTVLDNSAAPVPLSEPVSITLLRWLAVTPH